MLSGWTGSVRGRGLVVMPAAALLVHQLRYELAYGSGASRALAAQGHAYLASLTPWIVLLLCLGLGGFVARVARALATGRAEGHRRRSFVAVWLLSSVGLVAIYAAQEFLEALTIAAHPVGLHGIFGDGGWWALPVAAAVGAAVAALLRVAAAVVEIAAQRGAPPVAARVARPRWSPAHAVLPRIVPLASAHAGRAPPVAAR